MQIFGSKYLINLNTRIIKLFNNRNLNHRIYVNAIQLNLTGSSKGGYLLLRCVRRCEGQLQMRNWFLFAESAACLMVFDHSLFE